MSSGPFSRARYILDSGDVANIRVQPETLALSLNGSSNASASGSVTVPGSASVSRGKRSNGINARTVTIVFDTAPAGYLQGAPIRLPWLSPVSFQSIFSGSTGTYLGAAVTVIGRSPEQIR